MTQKRTFKQKLTSSLEAEDPYYVWTEHETSEGTVTKKIKKQIPEGLSKNDVKILKSCKRRAWWMDYFFGLCGLYAGWSVVIGLLPFVGCVINVWIGYQLIEKASQVDGGLSKWQTARMYRNLTFDAIISITPLVGDFFGAYYKCNARNCAILEHHLIEVSKHKTGKIDVPLNQQVHDIHTDPHYDTGKSNKAENGASKPIASKVETESSSAPNTASSKPAVTEPTKPVAAKH